MKGRTRHVEIPQEAWELARRPYDVQITHDNENGYVARVVEMPGLIVAEATMEDLRPSLEKMMALYITSDMLRGRPVPEPNALLTQR
ncbi:MAG: type II toxin-antitoxin system HicB family antitoxin [Chloroflexota bacterium]|nr:type II toxin-antitoxin system HicB family antitoxin [Chloroflexota bacterium]